MGWTPAEARTKQSFGSASNAWEIQLLSAISTLWLNSILLTLIAIVWSNPYALLIQGVLLVGPFKLDQCKSLEMATESESY